MQRACLNIREEPDRSSSIGHPHVPFLSFRSLQCPLYSAKAELLPGSTFVVGHDTAIRLVNPKYYGGHDGMVAAVRWKPGGGRSGGGAGAWSYSAGGDTPAPPYKQLRLYPGHVWRL